MDAVCGPRLSAYAVQSVQFAFHLKADNSSASSGWYIDNFRIYPATEGKPEAPDSLEGPLQR